LNKLFIAVTLLALIFIGFVTGAAVVRFEFFPYPYLKNSFAAAEALFIQKTGIEVPWFLGAKPSQPEDFAAPQVRDTEPGLGRYDFERVYDGLTIYTGIKAQFPIRLIDMQGNTVHQWELPFDELGGARDDGLPLSWPASALTVASSRLLPNGDLVSVLGTTNFTPWGYGIIKVDKDSNLLWKYMKQAHHDLDIAPDGRIFALLHEVVRSPWPGLERITTPFLDDQIAVLSPEGKELAVISVLQAIQDSAYQSLLMYVNPDQVKGDLLHVNSITWLDESMASHLPNAAAGDVLISMRQIDVLAVLDLETRVIKWAVRGPWHMQHDPDVLADGKVLLFDNRGDMKNGGTSRILEFDPETLEISWEYPGDSEEVLFTSIFGSQQRLPNGNTLISESNNGRILEVTREGDVVWEYKIPERKISYKGLEVATAVFAERFSPESLPFLQAP
jgi:hypothetical protein